VLRRKQPIVLDDENNELLPQREDPPARPSRDAKRQLDDLQSELEREPIGAGAPKSDRQSMEGLRAQYHWVLVNKGGEPETDLFRPSFKFDWSAPSIRIGLVVIALLAGGLAAYLVLQRNQPAEAPVQVEQTAAPVVAPPTTQILVATQPIGVGQRLSESALSWQEWPDTALRPEYITNTATPEAITDMTGTMVRFEIFPGEPIRRSKLIDANSGYLSAVLESGKRGVSVMVTADVASGGFIVPNDRVDVLLTRSLGSGALEAETILRNVRVLAIDKRLGETTNAPEAADGDSDKVFSNQAIAILELDAAGAEVVTNATSVGKLSLVVRSMADYANTESANATANQAIRMTSPFWTR
jgi:pilus assembly protein CpaB